MKRSKNNRRENFVERRYKTFGTFCSTNILRTLKTFCSLVNAKISKHHNRFQSFHRHSAKIFSSKDEGFFPFFLQRRRVFSFPSNFGISLTHRTGVHLFAQISSNQIRKKCLVKCHTNFFLFYEKRLQKENLV